MQTPAYGSNVHVVSALQSVALVPYALRQVFEQVPATAFRWHSAGSAEQSPMVVRDVQAILHVATAESHMHRETPSQLDDVVYPCMQVGWQERLNQRQFEFWPQEVADVASLHDSLQVPVVVFHAQPAPQFAGVVLARQDGLHC